MTNNDVSDVDNVYFAYPVVVADQEEDDENQGEDGNHGTAAVASEDSDSDTEGCVKDRLRRQWGPRLEDGAARLRASLPAVEGMRASLTPARDAAVEQARCVAVWL